MQLKHDIDLDSHRESDGRGPGTSDLGDVGAAKLAEVMATWGRCAVGPELDSVVEYCRLFERKAKADMQIKEHRELVANPQGFPVESPWLSVSRRAAEDMRKISKQLAGLARRSERR